MPKAKWLFFTVPQQRSGIKMNQFKILFFALISIVQAGYTQILPPEIPWHGRSEAFIRTDSNLWVTPAEKTDLTETPDYDSSISWLQRLVNFSPCLSMIKIGKTCQNRDLWLIIASKEGVTNSEDLKKNKRPTFLIQAGIHSGEIDGKDAGMMFLRDIVLDKSSLLDSINILFIPVLNPDGHERLSATNRINQRGPRIMGWRTNARNLNLNRDYSKVESSEIRSLLGILTRWPIDLYIDIHVTDGIDYQYDVTYGFNYWSGYSPMISQWLQNILRPEVNARLSAYGHIPGPLIFAADNKNIHAGTIDWVATPRFSNGYGDARHLPTVLVENHSLKNYKQRVLGTYIFLRAVADLLAKQGSDLQSAIEEDKTRRPAYLRIKTPFSLKQKLPDLLPFPGIDYRHYLSPVSGKSEIEWLGIPRLFHIPVQIALPELEIKLPRAYWIPASRLDIIKKLQIHGIAFEISDQAHSVEVELYRLIKYKLSAEAYEGRVLLEIDSLKVERQLRFYEPGSARISTDQPLGILAVLLIEPQSDDSFLQWGYFHEILQQTEYGEGYAIEPLARQMLASSPELRQAFNLALTDSSFASDAQARQQWFFERSPFYDREYLLYPVGREN
jgi:hypothetical protein